MVGFFMAHWCAYRLNLFDTDKRMNQDARFINKLAWLAGSLALSCVGLAGCSAIPTVSGSSASATSSSSTSTASQTTWQPQDQLKWDTVKLPGKQTTQYAVVKLNAHSTLQANAESSASMLRKTLRISPEHLNALAFEWQVPQLIANADMALRDQDDSPVRLVLAFEGDRSQFSAKNAMLNELTQAITGQPMPYATLMYVWCNKRPIDTVIHNPRTDRIRKIVVESGPDRLNQWLSYERNIRADFEKAFGEPPGALVGIGLMTDTDNTRSHAKAWYGTIQLK
jgi:hypothetical protein